MPYDNEEEIIVQTGAEKLLDIGKQEVIVEQSAHGPALVQDVLYPSQQHKIEERFLATQEVPEDENGLGYKFTNTTNKEV